MIVVMQKASYEIQYSLSHSFSFHHSNLFSPFTSLYTLSLSRFHHVDDSISLSFYLLVVSCFMKKGKQQQSWTSNSGGGSM